MIIIEIKNCKQIYCNHRYRRNLRDRAHRQSLHRTDEHGNGHADHFCRQLGLYPDDGVL